MIDRFDLLAVGAVVFVSWIIIMGCASQIEAAIRDLITELKEIKNGKK